MLQLASTLMASCTTITTSVLHPMPAWSPASILIQYGQTWFTNSVRVKNASLQRPLSNTYVPLSINIQMVLSFTLLNLDGRLELLGLQYLMDLLKLSISPEDSHSEHLLNALFLYVNMQHYRCQFNFTFSLPLKTSRSTAMDICLSVEV